ncbi:hypothetical protein DPMN_156833 [Dreissena polymorpha]|uniref:Uncharacterized protein n=1 Tax=Dreissena polymorpha TaxID=45954 RepID=A0A9D4FRX3_DREPO|nr:hypothetical protein DPMN_156833 [Dreissena polymorpha]
MVIPASKRNHWVSSGLSPRGQGVTGQRHGDPRKEKGSLDRVGVVADGTVRHC